MKEVWLYTDGACSSNGNIGGWAAILFYKNSEKVLSGGEADTTSNRMEMISVIEGLKALNQRCRVMVFSDSQYVVSAFNNGWISNWQKNGWRNANKDDVKNKELWLELISLAKKHDVTFNKVKGHSDDEQNNRCDKLARAEILKIRNKFFE